VNMSNPDFEPSVSVKFIITSMLVRNKSPSLLLCVTSLSILVIRLRIVVLSETYITHTETDVI